jgi:hypothetical protein
MEEDNTSARVVVRLKRGLDKSLQSTFGFDFDIEDNNELTDIKVTDEATKIHVNTQSTSNSNAQVFRCNHCFPHDTTQDSFFDQCEIIPILDNAVHLTSENFRSTCIMAYGQTGSGKTYSLFGSGSLSGESQRQGMPSGEDEYAEEFEVHSSPTDGLIVRSIEHLFNTLMRSHAGVYSIKLSSIEVCDDQVYDLFSGSNTLPVAVKEHITEGYTVHGCQFIECTDLSVAFSAIELIARHRRGAKVISPHHSHVLTSDVQGVHKVDRSHNITEIWVCAVPRVGEGGMSSTSSVCVAATDSGGPLRIETSANDANAGAFDVSAISPRSSTHGKITFVDLAGSERFKSRGSPKNSPDRKGSTKTAYKYLAQTDTDIRTINPSLYVLGRVIAGLVRTHNNIHSRDVPYKESVLTKLLIQTISHSYTTHSNLIIACLNESKSCEAETLRTLKFVTSCANVGNAPAVKLSKQDKLVVELKVNIKKVKQENAEMRRTILNNPSWGDKVLAHFDSQELESTLAFTHADTRIKPKVKDVRKDISTTTKSEKKRGWTSWKMFERNANAHSTVLVNIGAMGKTGAQIHPGGDAPTEDAQMFPTQQVHSKPHGGHAGTAPNSAPGSAAAGDHAASLDGSDSRQSGATRSTTAPAKRGGTAASHAPAATSAASSQRPGIASERSALSTSLGGAGSSNYADLQQFSFSATSATRGAGAQIQMDDLVRRRASGPMVFRGKSAERVDPILQSTTLHSTSAMYDMRMAEVQRTQQMKTFVETQCKKKGMASMISPYIGECVTSFSQCVASSYLFCVHYLLDRQRTGCPRR